MLPATERGGAIHFPLLASTLSRRRSIQISFPFKAESRQIHHQEQPQPQINPSPPTTRRRSALLLLSLSSLAHSPPASAISLGIPGPKKWLKDQKKKSAKFILAPIDASCQSLRNAYLLLESSDTGHPMEVSSEELRKMLNSAARDCVPQDRSSLVAFQASTGVEVCTFRLVLNNASSLLDDRDPAKLEAEALLDDLIRSFSFVGGAIDNSDFQLTSDRLLSSSILQLSFMFVKQPNMTTIEYFCENRHKQFYMIWCRLQRPINTITQLSKPLLKIFDATIEFS